MTAGAGLSMARCFVEGFVGAGRHESISKLLTPGSVQKTSTGRASSTIDKAYSLSTLGERAGCQASPPRGGSSRGAAVIGSTDM
eukprot:7163482-Pyramimonas_sp.AAC.1